MSASRRGSAGLAGKRAHDELSKSGAPTRRSIGGETPPILKMLLEREDWTAFRTVEGLQRKASVSAKLLRRLVLKEIADNSLDTGARIRFGQIGDRYFIEDRGPGLDGTPEEIASLFSIRRPMRSTKLLRLPQRGALGNGLRVVAGSVLASEGSLVVVTRNRRIVLQPLADGGTKVVKVTPADRPTGMRVEIGFGAALPRDSDALIWVRRASAVAGVGKAYSGRSSPYWYDGASFHELLLACGAQPVRSLIAELDGCTGGRAGEIVAAAGLERKICEHLDRTQAVRLLNAAAGRRRRSARSGSAGSGLTGFAMTTCPTRSSAAWSSWARSSPRLKFRSSSKLGRRRRKRPMTTTSRSS
jgi:hypothetical protein